jgi:hypothetical protein
MSDSIGTKSLFFWEMGQSPLADLLFTQIVFAMTAEGRDGCNSTTLSGFPRVSEKRITGAEDHMTHLQDQLDI